MDAGSSIAGWPRPAAWRVGRRAAGGSPRGTDLVSSSACVLLSADLDRPRRRPAGDRPTCPSRTCGCERLPAMTSWGRLEGELRLRRAHPAVHVRAARSRPTADLYVIVISDADLPDGHAMVTGRVSPRFAATGNVGTIEADVPAVPRVDEPIWLYLTPAVLALIIAIGSGSATRSSGVTAARTSSSPQLADGEPVPVHWSGRIGTETVEREDARPCDRVHRAGCSMRPVWTT